MENETKNEMEIKYLPERIRCLVFDIDGTLYDCPPYIKSHKDLLVARLAAHRNISEPEAEELVQKTRDRLSAANKGRKPSLGNTFVDLAIPIETSVKWREELYQPEEFLEHDPQLATALACLRKVFYLAVATNNPSSIGERTLQALGIREYFDLIIGLEQARESKPSMVPFQLVSQKLRIPLHEMVSIGDRTEVDLELPMQNDMGGILVHHVRELYTLPAFLAQWMTRPNGR